MHRGPPMRYARPSLRLAATSFFTLIASGACGRSHTSVPGTGGAPGAGLGGEGGDSGIMSGGGTGAAGTAGAGGLDLDAGGGLGVGEDNVRPQRAPPVVTSNPEEET